jgi:hypothetical protein
MEYESVTQKVLIPLESILQNAKQLQHARLSWHVRCPCGGVYRPALRPAQSALCRHGGEGGYEQPSKQSSVVYLTAKKLV